MGFFLHSFIVHLFSSTKACRDICCSPAQLSLAAAVFTSPQISQLAPHAQCSWILASPQDDVWPRPSSCWKCKPANHELRWALTPPASRWAHPQCPTDACRAERKQSQLGWPVTRIYFLHIRPAVCLTWSHRCKQHPTWQQRAPGSCGALAGPPHRGPSAPWPPSAWQQQTRCSQLIYCI